MVFNDAHGFHNIGGIPSPCGRGFPDSVMNYPWLRICRSTTRLGAAVARAVFYSMVYAPGLLRPAVLRRLRHLSQCVMNGLAGNKSRLRPDRRRAGTENFVVYLHPGRQILPDLIACALFRRRTRPDELLAGFDLYGRPVDIHER